MKGSVLCRICMHRGFLRKPAYGKIRKPADRIAVFPNEDFDWEQDMHPMLPYEDSTCYCLHVRGFTMHASSQVTHRGTFAGVVEKSGLSAGKSV